MSEEQRNEETEVEAHLGPKPSWPKPNANDEPREDDEVEGHLGGKTSWPKNS